MPITLFPVEFVFHVLGRETNKEIRFGRETLAALVAKESVQEQQNSQIFFPTTELRKSPTKYPKLKTSLLQQDKFIDGHENEIADFTCN